MPSFRPAGPWRAQLRLVVVLALAWTVAAGTLRSTGRDGPAAYFLVGFPDDSVTFVLLLTDPAAIAQARNILARQGNDVFGGIIVKSPASWNPGWSYHVDPGSVTFAIAFTEICDATPQYVEEHLSEVGTPQFLPGSYWCPWTSHLLREVTGPAPTATPQLQHHFYLPYIIR